MPRPSFQGQAGDLMRTCFTASSIKMLFRATILICALMAVAVVTASCEAQAGGTSRGDVPRTAAGKVQKHLLDR